MLLSMSDLACCNTGMGEVVFSKPTIDARTDPTKPPTAVIDTATGLVTPIPPQATVTVVEPEPWWQSLAVIGGAVLLIGGAVWLARRLAANAGDLDDAVIVRRRGRPVIVYDDEPDPIVIPAWRRRSEPTVVIEEPPNVLVNPPRGTFSEGRVTHFEGLLKEALEGTGAKVKIKYPRHGDVNVPYVEVTNVDYDAIAADMDLLLKLNKLVRSFGVDYDLTKSGVVIGRPTDKNPKKRSKARKGAKKSKGAKKRNFDWSELTSDDDENEDESNDDSGEDDLGSMSDQPPRFSLAELEAMPTISSGHMDDLKHDDAGWRVWISRMTVDDGADYDNMVTVERLRDGRWVAFETYEPD